MNAKIEITDVTGKLVYRTDTKSDRITFNRNELQSGVYFVKVKADMVMIGKMVVK
jgi:hypothetical protein